ncbi:amino acid permease [Phycicoccus sp. CSK15P-2]|uniref:basic amino acid/polyamine antiporter n=1 Tax=Phycicoccus sp. CSK15P-2 TaxID=2807627 RepID=UPI00194DCDFB|nr:basic amino acid/polyamine antiporter [Phycicoccus sp. CSK15P-2]MBM6405432.1 amino acid permease [Phycicoccus sp. CSK15P-2]
MTTVDQPTGTLGRVSLLTLTGVVVGSMVGGGVFTLPAEFGGSAGVIAAVVAWTLAGVGMLMIGFVFQSLAVRKPDLDSGVYVYAQVGFGNYAGFSSAFGYWASNIAGNVFYLVFTMTSLSAFFPGLDDGTTLLAVVLSSAGIWLIHTLVARGVREAAGVNRVVTVVKVVPILVFVVVVALAFDPATFAANLWGGEAHTVGSLFEQVTQTMLVTTFVFLGIEGASVYSRLARRREDVGRATLAGFGSVLVVFVLVTMVSYGVLPRTDLADAAQPSMGTVLEEVVGPWGATFVRVAVIVSVLGAYLAWTLLSAEVLYMPARTEVMPRFLRRLNRHETPIAALLTTSLAVQVLLLATFVVEDALDFMLKLDTALALIPYLLAASYALKLTVTGETYGAGDTGERRRQRTVAVLAVVYSVFLLYAAGVVYLLMACVVYAPGTLLYVMSRREQGLPVFRPVEAVVAAVFVTAGVVGVVVVATGALSI